MDNSRSASPVSRPDRDYDFRRCKFCGERKAEPLYRMRATTVYGCSECDFHAIDFLDAPPEDSAESAGSELDRSAWEYIDERVRAHDPLPELRLNLVREKCTLSGARCLDIGAGVGPFLLLLAAAGASPWGLEPSRIRREYARRKFGLDLHRETIESFCRLPEYAASFDLVTLWDVIEHVNFPVETLAAALQVLKPGGLLFIDTPSRDASAYRLSQLAYRLSGGKSPLFLETFYSPIPFGHKQIFRPEQLSRLAEKTGFIVEDVKEGYPAGSRLLSFLRPRNRIVMTCRRPTSQE